MDELDVWPRLRANREFSRRTLPLRDIRADLSDTTLDGVLSVAVAGSFGRDEASEASDADFIIILKDEHSEADPESVGREVYHKVSDPFVKRGIHEPNPAGVFATARCLNALLPASADGGIGQAGEESDVMGKRLLLLLESKAIWNESGYGKAIKDIFDRYAERVIREPRKEFVLLLNDLIRYFRYICVNYESTFGTQRDKWAIRNIKLRHSRLLMYFGLLVLLGEASAIGVDDKVRWVHERLALNPLQRVQVAYDNAKDSKFSLVAGLYNSFLESISDPSLREVLSAVTYEDRYNNHEFARLKANSDAFQGELARFCYGQRGRWSDRFYEYLVF